MTFRSGKIYTHNQGLSVAFRQWKAKDSSCQYIHGYALQVELEFERQNGGLDSRNWVMGFGDLRPIKTWLEKTFDHKLLVDKLDPDLKLFQLLEREKLVQLNIVEGIGMESFCHMVYKWIEQWLISENPGVKIKKVIIREHEGNWASYSSEKV